MNYKTEVKHEQLKKVGVVKSAYYDIGKKNTIIKVREANGNRVVTVNLKGGMKVQPFLTEGKMIAYETGYQIENTYEDNRFYRTEFTNHVRLGETVKKK